MFLCVCVCARLSSLLLLSFNDCGSWFRYLHDLHGVGWANALCVRCAPLRLTEARQTQLLNSRNDDGNIYYDLWIMNRRNVHISIFFSVAFLSFAHPFALFLYLSAGFRHYLTSTMYLLSAFTCRSNGWLSRPCIFYGIFPAPSRAQLKSFVRGH